MTAILLFASGQSTAYAVSLHEIIRVTWEVDRWQLGRGHRHIGFAVAWFRSPGKSSSVFSSSTGLNYGLKCHRHCASVLAFHRGGTLRRISPTAAGFCLEEKVARADGRDRDGRLALIPHVLAAASFSR